MASTPSDFRSCRPSQKKRKLALVKCERCRLDKQKCLPIDRLWPKKCDRCFAKDFPCSEGKRVARYSKHDTIPVALDEAQNTNSENPHARSDVQRKVKQWMTLNSYYRVMDKAMVRFDELRTSMVELFLDDWHSQVKTNDWDCDALLDFYADLEDKLYGLAKDLITVGPGTGELGSRFVTEMIGHTVPLFSWQYACPVCFETGDEDILKDMNERRDFCAVYLLRMSRLSRHMDARAHWTEESPSLLQAELAQFSLISSRAALAFTIVLKETDLYESLPTCSRSNLTFRSDNINYQMLLGDMWEMDCLGRTALHQSMDALYDRSEKVPGHLCAAFSKGDINAQDILGRTLLHIACEQNSMDAVQHLLSNGANPALTTVYGSLPIHYAAARGSLGICKLLLSHLVLGYDINEADLEGNTALYYAVNSKNEGLVEFLLAEPHKMDPNSDRLESPSVPPLIRAIHLQSEELVRLLLASGADPHAQHAGYSASHYAAQGDKGSISSLLLEAVLNI